MSDATYKLGKLPPKKILGLPSLSKYAGTLPVPPVSVDYGGKLKKLGMMLNDQIGLCVVAASGHAIQTWTSDAQDQQVILPDAEILALYRKLSGYVPGDPNTDTGLVASDFLRYWYNNQIDGHKLSAFASVHPGKKQDVQLAIWLFGVCFTGVQLPLTAQNGPWDVPVGTSISSGDSAAGSWGGHAIPVVAYDEKWLTCITWGALKKMSWSFWNAYVDETYCLLSPDWIEKNGKSPGGETFSALQSDIQGIRNTLASIVDDMQAIA